MRLQLLSDLHLETETFEPRPAPDAELLVLAGDIDSRWVAFEKFRGWPVPIVMVAGNHEFDGRELDQARPALRTLCEGLGIRLLECESLVVPDRAGRRIRFVGTTRWSDFDLYGAAGRERAMRAAKHFMKLMRAGRRGQPFDAAAVRDEALACRDWLRAELSKPVAGWDRTVVVTHFAPSLRSADPRYGAQPGTASFCNADDDLLPFADLWLHGHLHCAHDYAAVDSNGKDRKDGQSGTSGTTRVVCNPRGHAFKGEAVGHQPLLVLEV